MTTLLLLAALAARFDACTALVQSDPVKAIAEAEAWRDSGGGMAARVCLGLAFAAAERWAPAALAFEQAARAAELDRDGRAADLWVQSGNASLAGDDPGKARLAFDRALALPGMSDAMRGEALLDRARALVETRDLPAARADLDAALALVPSDPMAWLLSAALARREGKLDRAHSDLAEAEKRAPGEAAIADERARIDGVQAPAEAAIEARP